MEPQFLAGNNIRNIIQRNPCLNLSQNGTSDPGLDLIHFIINNKIAYVQKSPEDAGVYSHNIMQITLIEISIPKGVPLKYSSYCGIVCQVSQGPRITDGKVNLGDALSISSLNPTYLPGYGQPIIKRSFLKLLWLRMSSRSSIILQQYPY